MAMRRYPAQYRALAGFLVASTVFVAVFVALVLSAFHAPRPHDLLVASGTSLRLLVTQAGGVRSTFERREESPADAILHAAGLYAAADPASPPVIVAGRSHHAMHHVLGSVPVRLLNQSPYPVVTIE